MCLLPSHYDDVKQPLSDASAQDCLPYVLSHCNISVSSDDDIVVLREGQEHGCQAVIQVSKTWIVRIFKLYDGYRQSSDTISKIMQSLQGVVPVQPIGYHGTVPSTHHHYIVTQFVDGQALTEEQCKIPSVQQQYADFIKGVRSLLVPPDVTVKHFMQPRLLKLQALLAALPDSLAKRVGPLCSLDDFQDFRMVVRHNDMALKNILMQGETIAAVIDWEFASYKPEFADALWMSKKAARDSWGEDFPKVHNLGFKRYSDRLLWTENLCFFAEEYESEFSRHLEEALDARVI
ncbi:hypothetical protein BU17DRAFT_60001 [Hysterangium stoloniferum]|nr:hypothetical protein BU17DRAFT_60001 [Hysterangium stoloniferum]